MRQNRVLIAAIMLLSLPCIALVKDVNIGDKNQSSIYVLRKRYGEFSTAGAFISVCVENKDLKQKSTIVCENAYWYDILTKKTNYFKGSARQYVDFMLKNHDQCFQLSADVFKELSKTHEALRKDAYEMDMDKVKGVSYVANKYLKKNFWNANKYDYVFRDNKYESDRSLLRMLLELGLVVRRDCESGQGYIEPKEIDAVHK